MSSYYSYEILNPSFNNLGYIKATANVMDKHDRSTPSNYHWKILKCRMIIFSASSILSCPDKTDVRQIHLIFNKTGDDYDCLTKLFSKYSLIQDGGIHQVTSNIYSMCFLYTMSAKIAPVWNYLGPNLFINNRDFLKACGPQDGIKLKLTENITDDKTILHLKPVKIHLIKTKEKFTPGEQITVLPSLNKALIEEFSKSLPESGDFKCYKDIRRHWKNIHGYRLPDEEYSYYTVRFWRGEPLTYPEVCLLRSFPIVTPIHRDAEFPILSRFINTLKNKMPHTAGVSHSIFNQSCQRQRNIYKRFTDKQISETQAISLCTPSQD